ncbi:MAG: class I SAM-dependent methyltransferase [Flavobacteriales bacterium]|nr:class I SAM-dependent methyltransferase [Flavobacteriales bacterium]
MGNKQWFETWFDSPYYYTLYDHRNYEEAETFIRNILGYLNPKANASFLDLACGAGRHSKFINSFGHFVTGVDLSPNSIVSANKLSNNSLNFFVHDMRSRIKAQSFDYVFNLFTSFGYFENQEDNLKVLQAINSELNKNGTVIIDFMNTTKVIKNLVTKETIEKQGITFNIKRAFIDGIITKQISFRDNSKEHQFEERVQAIYLKDFTKLCNQAGFSIVKVFGNYALEKFDKDQSDRLIMVLR